MFSSTQPPYIFIASMDVEPAYDSLFNEIYNTEHIRALETVPGVLGIGRYERVELKMAISGRIEEVKSDQPRYHALYALDDARVLSSEAWAEAVEFGRWPEEVRPHTRNRRHMLTRYLSPEPPAGTD